MKSVGETWCSIRYSPAGEAFLIEPAGEMWSVVIESPKMPRIRASMMSVTGGQTYAWDPSSTYVQNPPYFEGMTKHFPSGDVMSIYDAAMRYQAEGRPLVVFAGKEYGTGSSRDWAAKGTRLLGVRAVLAESYERIHRSNLVGMGVLPLQFRAEGWQRLNLTGEEIVNIRGLEGLAPRKSLTVEIYRPSDGRIARFPVVCRIDTPTELAYFRDGGVLPYVLRNLARPSLAPASAAAE